MTNHDLLQIGLSVSGALGTAAIGLLWKLVGNVVQLNQNITVIISRVDSHEKRIEHVENVLIGSNM